MQICKMFGWVVVKSECERVEKKFEINTIQWGTEFNTKSKTIQSLSVNGVKIASIELTKPPKLTILKNGILKTFASTEYVLKVLK